MHSNVRKMLSKIGYAMPLGSGVIVIYGNPDAALWSRVLRPAIPRHSFRDLSIHLFFNLIHSL